MSVVIAEKQGFPTPAINTSARTAALKSAKLLRIFASVSMVATPLFAFVLSVVQLKGGWDDAAITAAFARTYAETGRFALTPISAQVEGFSSLTWTLLLSLARLISSSPVSMLVWMKLVAAVSFTASLLIFRRLAKRLFNDGETADLATLLLAFFAPPMLETLNGMEMNLYMLLILGLVYVVSAESFNISRVTLTCVLVSLIIATRFESPFLLCFVVGALWLAGDRFRSALAAGATLTAFAGVELWRYWRFRIWLPNTVYAKMHFPYSPRPHDWYAFVRTRLLATTEIGSVLHGLLLGALLSLGFLWLKNRGLKLRWSVSVAMVCAVAGLDYLIWPYVFHWALWPVNQRMVAVVAAMLVIAGLAAALQLGHSRSLDRIVFALSAATLMFGAIFGRNWGHDGRMIQASLPFVLLSIVLYIHKKFPDRQWRSLVLGGCILAQLTTWISVAQNAWLNGDPLVSIATVERTGVEADLVRRLINRSTISILLPDVGGSTLCCEHLIVFDSALLANPDLANPGYAGFGAYLASIHPDVIETHGGWSRHSDIYSSEVLNDYSIAVVNGVRLLLRNDVYAQFELATHAPKREGPACQGNTEANKEDTRFVLQRGQCLYYDANGSAEQ